MVEQGQTEKNRKKSIAAVVAIACVLIMLLSGTYAWYDTMNEINEFEGENIIFDNDIVLHDHFLEGESKNYTKEIFVENTGEDSLFVRLRLDEYMEVDGDSTILGADVDDLSSWHRHNYAGGTCADCGEQFHTFWSWEMGGSEPIQYLPSEDHERGVVNRFELSEEDAQKWLFSDSDEGAWTNAGEQCDVITMADYQEFSETQKDDFIGWILDSDAYAYWSQKLEPGTATGQILSQVNKRGEIPGKEYHYAINVFLEAVDEEDVLAWIYGDDIVKVNEAAGAEVLGITEKATEAAVKLLKSISDRDLDADHFKRVLKEADEFDVVLLDGVEWIITEKSDSMATILKKNTLYDAHPFVQVHQATSWEDSYLREYLNTTYYDSLNSGLQSMILSSWIQTGTYTGQTEYVRTRDKIYIPSEEEVLSWFADNEARVAYREGTTSPFTYWLRTPYNQNLSNYRYVLSTGEIETSSNQGLNRSYGVRPMMQVTLY